MLVFSQYSRKHWSEFPPPRLYVDHLDLFSIYSDLYTSIRNGNGHRASRIAYKHTDVDVFTDVKVPTASKISEQVVLVGRAIDGDPQVLFDEGFDYYDLHDSDIEDLTFEPYTLPPLSLYYGPAETPSLYRDDLPMYPVKTHLPKSLYVLENVRASAVDPLCRIGRVLYRDWHILNEVYKVIKSSKVTYIHHGTYRTAKFRCYPHNMLCQDLMVILDVHDAVEDVFQVDAVLLGKIAKSTVY